MVMRRAVLVIFEMHAIGAILAGTAAMHLGYNLSGKYLILWAGFVFGIIGGHLATKYGWLR